MLIIYFRNKNMNRLFVTRFNNKTWGENLRYNNKRQNCEYEKHCFNTCEHWEKFSIPYLEQLYKKHRKMTFRVDTIEEKRTYRRKMRSIKKDIRILNNAIKSHYNDLNERLYDSLYYKDLNKTFIYNSPIIIHPSVEQNSCIFVFEMNNDLNKVSGIFKMNNKLLRKRHIIYNSMNYNRYSYLGKRKDRSCFDEETMNIIDNYLFKGSTHQKRGQGIQRINANISRRIFELIQSELKYFN